MISLESTIIELKDKNLISVRLANACLKGKIDTLGDLLTKKKFDLYKIKNCGYKTILEIEDIKSRYINLIRFQNQKKDDKLKDDGKNNSTIPVWDYKIRYNKLITEDQNKIKSIIKEKFKLISVRCRHQFPSFGNLEVLLPYWDSTSDILNLNFSCGRKTLYDIKNYLSDARDTFDKFYIEQVHLYPSEEEALKIKKEYPFLLATDCKEVVDHLKKTNLIPFLFIIAKYIFQSDNRRNTIFKDFYGIGGSQESLQSICLRYELTQTRVKQIVSSTIRLPQHIKKIIPSEFSTNLGAVVSERNQIWTELKKLYMMSKSELDILLLASLIIPEKIIFQLGPCETKYLIDKELLRELKPKSVIRNIEKEINKKRTIIKELDILQIIKTECPRCSSRIEFICPIFAEYFEKNKNLQVKNDRYITLFPNKTDISLAIEHILRDKGVPMSLSELMVSYNEIYLEKIITSKNNFKAYIARNPNIKGKGRSGMYVLTSWKSHYTGSIISYIKMVLSTFEKPLKLELLVDFIRDQFPSTNRKSILSLISQDKSNEIVLYKDDLVGIRNEKHTDIITPKKIIKKEQFLDKWASYKTFVKIHKRLPFYNGETEEEQSLGRWMKRLKDGKNECDSENLTIITSFLDTNASLPQNKTEYNFKQVCDQIKVIVAKTFSLPERTENEYEYNWLKNSIQSYSSISHNKKIYFDDLVTFLKDFGFYILPEDVSISDIDKDSISHKNSNSEDIFLQNNTVIPDKNISSLEFGDGKFFYIKTLGCEAKGILTHDKQIVICKGSLIRENATNTYDRKDFRNQLIKWYCSKTDKGYIANLDLPPMSPSGASSFVQGRSSNGKRDWKDKNGNALSKYL